MNNKNEILIVEDSITQAEYLKYLLELEKYTVVHCFNSNDALNYLKQNKVSLIISDIIMPDINGYEFCKILKNNAHTTDIPVILLTTLSGSTDILEGLESGADSFISKPFNPDYLFSTIEKVLGDFNSPSLNKEIIEFNIEQNGSSRKIISNKNQILSFLLSAYDSAVQTNKDLLDSQKNLTELNENLESIVEKRTNELLESNEYLEKLINHTNALILVWDNDFNIIKSNSLFENTLGVSFENIYGKNLDEVFSESQKMAFDDLLINSKGEGILETIEMEFITKNNQRYIIEWNISNIYNADKSKILATIAHGVDRTEKKKTQEKLLKTMEELKRSNIELEQFAYVASHDLQEPLRMVGSYTQLLARKYKEHLDDDAKEFIHYAVDGTQRMKKMITDLLEFSRVGTKGKEFTEINTNEIVQSALNNLSLLINDNSANIEIDNLPFLKADGSQIMRVFQNLTENALKFKSQDAVPYVKISCDDIGQHFQFSLQDNGIGIKEEFQERIFGIFQRLHTREEYPGTGIGLSITKRIIERHGGKIWFESIPNNGTTFYFTINKNIKIND